jgi:hypothetical protein
MIQSATSGSSVIFSWRSDRFWLSDSTSNPRIRRRSSSPSASNTMISSMRLMNSGLNVRFTSPSTMSETVRLISLWSADWNPRLAFFWM